MSQAEKGCHASWAMEAMDPMSEYWLPFRLRSDWRSKTAPVPRTALSKTFWHTASASNEEFLHNLHQIC